MSDPTSKDLLNWASRRAESRPFFLAGYLKMFRELEGLDDQGLAEYLGCDVSALTTISLCAVPNASSSSFRRDVEQVASYVGARAEKLAQILREVESSVAIQSVPLPPTLARSGQAYMLAARDKPKPRSKK